MKSALVTGILGQDGPYLAEQLLEKGYKVFGLIRRYANPPMDNLKYLEIQNDIELVTGDLTDENSLFKLIKDIRPDECYHLAAQSFVGSSWDLANTTIETNTMGTLYLLNAIKMHAHTCKTYFAGTSEMYGHSVGPENHQDENTPFHPRSPYAISKLAGYWLFQNFKESYNMFCACGILFNHTSPIRGMDFATRKVSYGVAKIKLGLADKITLGNLDAKRDWGAAWDYTDAMWRMLQQPEPDNFVICSGEAHSIRELVEIAFNKIGVTDWEKYVESDPRLKRPADVNTLLGSYAKAKRILGWEPKTKFKDLVKIMVATDIRRLEVEGEQE